jgi:hypothetical protein
VNNIIIYSWLLLAIGSCKKTEKSKAASGGTYFSVTQFARDQFSTFSGQPYTLQKVVTLNGKVDSSFVQAMTLDWGSVLKPFFESDISDRKFLDQYNFNLFDDNATDSRNYFYEAKDKKLLTRNLQISTDPFNNRIKSIYVETEKNGKVQKLFYRPLKLIQIQEYESSFLGTDKNLKVEYYFM